MTFLTRPETTEKVGVLPLAFKKWSDEKVQQEPERLESAHEETHLLSSEGEFWSS